MNTSYFSRFAKDLFLAVISVLTLSIFQNANATIYYVKTTGVATNNGLSWDSTKTFQSALDAATAGDTIWVASGTYVPDQSPDGTTSNVRNYSFHWDKDLKIFGGFDGTETELDDRDFNANTTTLSGSHGAPKSYHVIVNVKTSNKCILDGFTIRDGEATTGTPITYSSETIYTSAGGGMYNYQSEIRIFNCDIRHNKSSGGGGMYNYQSAPLIRDVTFFANSARNSGGGMLNVEPISSGAKIGIFKVAFASNSADNGGGMYNIRMRKALKIANTLFTSNSASKNGGAIYFFDTKAEVVNSTFSSNRVTNGHGGAIYSTTNSDPLIYNSIFWNNKIGSKSNANTLVGSDLYGVKGSGTQTPSYTVQYSRLQLTSTSYSTTSNNRVSNSVGSFFQTPVGFLNEYSPLGPDLIYRTSDDGHQLTKCSELVNKGDNSRTSGLSNDLLDNRRISIQQVDLGAYEYEAPSLITRIYVDHSATGDKNGRSWKDAFSDLQSALDLACEGDTIWVREGTYVPTQSPYKHSTSIRDRAFHWDRDITILGGFKGTEVLENQRDWKTNKTILSGDLDTSNKNCFHVLVSLNLSNSCKLDGFIITKGQGDSTSSLTYGGETFFRARAGGLYNVNSSPTVSNCIFVGNSARIGGAISNVNSSSVFRNVQFLNNHATISSGGAITNGSNSSPMFQNVVFANNSAARDGGALNNVGQCKAKMVNVVFSNNSAVEEGGAIYASSGGSDSIANSTFVNNKAQTGGAIYLRGSSRTGTLSTTVTNSIFWGNKANGDSTANNSEFYGNVYTRFYIQHSILQLATANYTIANLNLISSPTNNQHNKDPKFFSYALPFGQDSMPFTSDDGLHLKSNSSAIDSGSNALVFFGATTDILGSNRIQDSLVNLGAYEDVAGRCSKKSPLPSAPGIYTASESNQDSNFTCYCDSDGYFILALDTLGTGAIVPADSVQLKIDSSTVSVYQTAGGLITNDSGGVVFNRKWNVNPVRQPSSPVRVLYGFTNREFEAVRDSLRVLNSTLTSASQIHMYKITGGSGFVDPHDSGVTGIVLASGAGPSTTVWKYQSHENGVDHTAEYFVSNFSGGGGGGGGGGGAGPSPLPVELIRFTATAQENHTSLLEWATASEENNSHFIVERSLDGIEFLEIGLVYGMGTTSSLTTYQFADIDLSIGTEEAFYRLRQVDFDGGFEYSEMRFVNFHKDLLTELRLYPNPASTQMYVRIPSKVQYSQGWEIINLQGQTILEGDVPQNSAIQIDVSSFNAGVYLFQIQGTIYRFVVDQ
jgi:predicted outer membrane repeat protein